MTGLMHEKEFSRKSVPEGRRRARRRLLGRRLGARRQGGRGCPDARRATCPTSTRSTRGSRSTPTTRSTLKTSQIEVGNGITTGFLQVAGRRARHGHVADALRPCSTRPRRSRDADTWVAVSTGGEGGSNAMSGTGPKIRNVGALARQALLDMASTKLGVPVASLTVGKGVVSGGGKTVTYGAAHRRQAVQHHGRERRRCSRVSRRRSRCRPTRPCTKIRTRSSGSTSRTRSPASTRTCTTSAFPGCCTAGWSGRAVRVRIRTTRTSPVSVDASVDRAHSGCAGRPGEQLPRRCRAEGVRRDPGGRAAQGRLEHEPDPAGHGQPLEALPRHGRARGRSRHTYSAVTKGNVDAALAASAHTVVGYVRAPLPGPHADRAELLRSPTFRRPRRRSGATPRTSRTCVTDLANVLSPLQANQIRVDLLRGLGLVRQRLCRVRHGRVGGDHVEGASASRCVCR